MFKSKTKKDKRILISGNQKEFESLIPISKTGRKDYFKKIRDSKRKARKEYVYKEPEIKLGLISRLKYKFYDKTEFVNKSLVKQNYNSERRYKVSQNRKELILETAKFIDGWKKELRANKAKKKEVLNNKDKVEASKNAVNIEKVKVETEFKKTVADIKAQFKNKEISRKAYNDSVTRARFFKEGVLNELKDDDIKHKAAEDVKYSYLSFLKRKKKINKRKEAELVFISNEIPNDERWLSRRYITPWLELLFPGLGSLLNKEYGKAFISAIGTIVIYGIAIMFATGYISISINGTKQGNGIVGLIHLGATEASSGVYQPDSRFYLIFGILSILFICIALVYGLLMSRIAYKKALTLSVGADNARLVSTKIFLQTNGFPYMIASPVYLIITFTTIFPLLTSMVIVFTNFGSKGHIAPAQLINWVGFDNLKAVFDFNGAEGHYFAKTLSWSFIWGIGSSFTSVFSGLALALLVEHPRLKGKKYIRPLFMLPMAIPFFIIVLYFKIFFGPTGAMNHDVVRAFAPWHPITKFEIAPGTWQVYSDNNWFSDVATVKFLLFFLNIWLNFAGTFLFVTGLLQGISKDLYEAADIAGASSFRKFTNITGPILLYRVAPILISAFIGGFNNFGLIYLFVEGGPHTEIGGPGDTDILASYVFSLVKEKGKPALAASYMFIISLAFGGIGVVGFSRTKIFRGDKKKDNDKKPFYKRMFRRRGA